MTALDLKVAFTERAAHYGNAADNERLDLMLRLLLLPDENKTKTMRALDYTKVSHLHEFYKSEVIHLDDKLERFSNLYLQASHPDTAAALQ